ncbi:MAG TPA: orotate phosphoribosyltransferase [Tepidisphaeraceae bacterium]|nr:orotate phosphoribosyltransferase [Tepidisphaeraceae bacterium]
MPAKYPELAKFLQQKSLKRGHFVLASGRTSEYYIDGKLTCFDPQGSKLIVEAILNEIKNLPVDAVGGMDMGATPIVGSFVNRCAYIGKAMPTFIVRKDVKAHGTMKLIEGNLPAPCSVVLLDDVVTTGESILKAVKAVRDKGCKVLMAISVLDRNGGARELMEKEGIPYHPLATLEDIGIVPEAAATR